MSKEVNTLPLARPIPAFDDSGRVSRARSYMEKMAVYANGGLLAESTLLRLQASSSTVLGMGLPDLVLRRGEDGVWYVFDKGAWTLTEADWEAGQAARDAVNTGPVNSPDVNTDLVNTDLVNTEQPVNTDRKAYMREYMRAKRAKERGE